MPQRDAQPGIGRERRLGDEGLRRLEAQLTRGTRLSDAVLAQWLRRYGEAARQLLRAHGCYHRGLEE
jgi:hypothetical protein